MSRWLTGDVDLCLGGVVCRLVHLPGHSAGHMGVWLPESRTLIGGDAVMGRGIPKCDGELLYGPQFLDPRIYLATIDRIENLAPDLLLLAHEEPLSGEAVGAFLEASRAAVHLIEQLTLDAVGDRAVTLMEVCSYVHERYGGLPEGGAADIAPSVAGILAASGASGQRRVRRGRIAETVPRAVDSARAAPARADATTEFHSSNSRIAVDSVACGSVFLSERPVSGRRNWIGRSSACLILSCTSRSARRTRTRPGRSSPICSIGSIRMAGSRATHTSIPARRERSRAGSARCRAASDAVVFFVGVDDVSSTLERAEELGGRTVQPATEVPGVTFGLLADADGHMIGVAAM